MNTKSQAEVDLNMNDGTMLFSGFWYKKNLWQSSDNMVNYVILELKMAFPEEWITK